MISRTTESGEIPVVDLSAFTTDKQNADKDLQREAADELIRVCTKYGCAGIAGHGLSPSTLNGLWQTSRQIFGMPLEDKMKAPHPTNGFIPHRGYTPVGGEKAFRSDEMAEHGHDEEFWKTKISVTDYKESFEIGSASNKVHGNLWYPDPILPELRSFGLGAYEELHQVCMNILEAFLVGLKITQEEKDTILATHSGVNDHLRLMHYPSLPSEIVESPTSGRMQAHTDWGTFTLLFQDTCGGLEFADPAKDGEFLPATPLNDVLYLNVADMMNRISNGRLPSALHRVVIPTQRVQTESGEIVTPDRYSIPFFMNPDDDQIVATPESLIKADGVRKYEPIVFGDYLASRAKWLFKNEYAELRNSQV